jgi:ABC-type transport system involved in cytochrome bd biosynthesis fused ATPase/permease subunit
MLYFPIDLGKHVDHRQSHADDDRLPPVLKGITLSIKGGEKIGVIGRTGAGSGSSVSEIDQTYRIRIVHHVGTVQAGRAIFWVDYD